MNLGALLIATDRADRAVDTLETAIRLAPECAAAHVNLAMVHAALGYDEAALRSIRRGLELHPQHVDALKRCAALLKKLGRGAEAVPFYERATGAEQRPRRTSISGISFSAWRNATGQSTNTGGPSSWRLGKTVGQVANLPVTPPPRQVGNLPHWPNRISAWATP